MRNVMATIPTSTQIQEIASEAAFGRPLVTNVLRGHIAEAIVSTALSQDWSWCAADYAAWDFERNDGLRLEVKQSASRQSWAAPNQVSACYFDIAHRTGHYQGATWIEGPCRQADIYVFAHHPEADDRADHRDPAQWVFYTVATSDLPPIKKLSLSSARQLSPAWKYTDLASSVGDLATGLVRRSAGPENRH